MFAEHYSLIRRCDWCCGYQSHRWMVCSASSTLWLSLSYLGQGLLPSFWSRSLVPFSLSFELRAATLQSLSCLISLYLECHRKVLKYQFVLLASACTGVSAAFSLGRWEKSKGNMLALSHTRAEWIIPGWKSRKKKKSIWESLKMVIIKEASI